MTTAIYATTIACLALNLLALLLANKKNLANKLMLAAFFAGIILFTLNWILAQAAPFGNMRHVLCFFACVLYPSLLLLKKRSSMELTGYFALAGIIALSGALSMPLQAAWRQMPALQSPWFAPHVTSYVISYGLMLVATLLVLRSLYHDQENKIFNAADAVVRLSLPFMTFGLWSGAIWADGVWGGYWAWDIKEVWSLITWTLYLIYLHIARHPVSPAYKKGVLILAFAALVTTFLVVNLLPRIESVHSYAQ